MVFRVGDSAGQADHVLIERTRRGDERSYAQLWRRHYQAAVTVARLYTSSLDAEDLVSEAYLQILAAIRRGSGPTSGAFRPYLYTVVRNIAHRWGSARREITLERFPDIIDETDSLDKQLTSLDHGMTRDAFQSLPRRWQEVLWYTEIEQMTPAAVAPLLGISANSVAALAYRAKEGLRRRWLQAHVAHAQRSGECAWALDHVGEHSRAGLTPRNTRRIEQHFAECTSCGAVAAEVGEFSRQLVGTLAVATLGGGVAALWFTSVGHGTGAAAANTAAAAGVVTAVGGVGGVSLLGAGAASVVTVVGIAGGLALLGPTIDSDAMVPPGVLAAAQPFGPPAQPSSGGDEPGDDVRSEGDDAAEPTGEDPVDDGDPPAENPESSTESDDDSTLVFDLVTGVTDTVDGTTGLVTDLVDALTGGEVTTELDVSISDDGVGVGASVGVGDVEVDAGVHVGGDSVIDTSVDVGGVIGVDVTVGGGDGGGLLGLGILGIGLH